MKRGNFTKFVFYAIVIGIIISVAFCGCGQEPEEILEFDNRQDVGQNVEEAGHSKRGPYREYREDVRVKRDSRIIYITYSIRPVNSNGLLPGSSLAIYTYYLNQQDNNTRGCLRLEGAIGALNSNRLRVYGDSRGPDIVICVNDGMRVINTSYVPDCRRAGGSRHDYRYDCNGENNQEFCNDMQGVFDDWATRLDLRNRIAEGRNLPEINPRIYEIMVMEHYRPVPERFLMSE